MSRSSIFREDLFQGKVAIVTGGGSGIGLAISEELARGGASVVIASRNLARLNITARGLSHDHGVEVVPVRCNIRSMDEIEALFDQVIERFGKVDFLVNNGGGQFHSPAEDISEKGWKAVIDTNVNGTWNMCITAAKKWMLEHGGNIVTIVANVWRGFPGMVHTATARAGIVAMTKTLAIEWAKSRIRINCVAPGTILSTGMKNYPEGWTDKAWRVIPLKRLGYSEEVAWAVAYLLSPASDFTTGETIKLDGGASLWGDRWPIPDPPEAPEIDIPPWPEERWPEFATNDDKNE